MKKFEYFNNKTNKGILFFSLEININKYGDFWVDLKNNRLIDINFKLIKKLF